MKTLIQENKLFLGLYVLFLVAGAALMLVYERGTEIIYFNNLHTKNAGLFFLYITKLAEWPAFVLMALFLVFTSYGKGLVLLVNFLATSGVVQILKKFLFQGIPRPASEMASHITLNFVPGMPVYYMDSFPSGHTAAAFALFFTLSILIKQKTWSVLFFVLAMLVAVSRVYLLQHYFRDVYAGSLVGMTVSLLGCYVWANSTWFMNWSWRNKTLLR